MSAVINFHILTLFPEMINGACSHSILKRAREAGQIGIHSANIRDFTLNKHGQVDDAPYGGGAGMVIMPGPVFDGYNSIVQKTVAAGNPVPRLLYLSPHGRRFDQAMAEELSREKDIILICGHYEGIDQRVIDLLAPEEVSVGDFVLTGGELAALVVIDSVARLIPGVLGKDVSSQDESFGPGLQGMLEYPQYTRPPVFEGRHVPEVLLSGNHKEIEKWRKAKSHEITMAKRPDLLNKYS